MNPDPLQTEALECARAAALLPDYWQHALAAPEGWVDRQWLESHLQACRACAALTATWESLGGLPAVIPDAAQRGRLEALIAAAQATPPITAKPARELDWAPAGAGARPAWRDRFELGRGGRFGGGLWRRPGLAAAVLLLCGLGAGWWARGLRLATSTAAAASARQEREIAELRAEVRSNRQLAVLSLMQQQSANDRLQGVSYSARLPAGDTQVIDALLRSLRFDSSPDVRLAALDVLSRQASLPLVQKGMVEAFHDQTSPLVQIALVDSLVSTQNPEARPLLKQISADTQYLAEVRRRAAWGLGQPLTGAGPSAALN